jgi:hypothetical protein
MKSGDNPDLLNQDCSQPLFRWFLSRIDWRRTLVELCREKTERENSMNLEIAVLVKDIYGQRKFYPKCDKSKVFASIAGTTTLTETTLKNIVKLGYKVNVKQEPIEIQVTLK